MMVTFYPRDIGMWRSEYSFGRNKRPSKRFANFDDLKQYILEKCGQDEEYPLTFIEEVNECLETTHVVHKWTVLGWAKETK